MPREHVHLIGIGGTGMTALAGLLTETGCRVSGSDGRLYPPTSTILERLDVEVRQGFDPANLSPQPDLVVVGNAISRGNPEVEEVLDRGLEYTSMPRLIQERFLRGRHSVVVAGTHGKTTTSSMLAWVLHSAGRDPGFLIGGAPLDLDLPFRVGTGEAFVIEGDEYDTAFFDKGPKFMHYRPDTVLLGPVEFDHADIYRDLRQIKTTFHRLVLLVPRRGLILRHDESETTREVTAGAPSRVEGCGVGTGFWRAEEIQEQPDGTAFRVFRRDEPFVEVTLRLSGLHNVRNALGVIGAANELGLSGDEIAEGLCSFRGVRRRLELRGEARGVRVIDDFAHHPTAIAETLRAVRARNPSARIWAVVEPRSWSLRRNVFQERLAGVFGEADRVVLADVFAADAVPPDQRLDVARLVADIEAGGGKARHLADADAITEAIGAQASEGDIVVVMSNGAFGGVHERILNALRERVTSDVARLGAGHDG